MKHGWLLTLCVAFCLSLARPAYCVDQALRREAVDSLLARDAAEEKLLKAQKAASEARATWLKSWTNWEVSIAKQQTELAAGSPSEQKAAAALKTPSAPPKPDDAKLTSAGLKPLEDQVVALKKMLDAGLAVLGAGSTHEAELKKTIGEVDATLKEVATQKQALAAEEKAFAAAEAKHQKKRDAFEAGTGPVRFLSERLRAGRELRCLTAYCYGGGDGTKYGIEPVLDLPVGLVWSAGSGALSSYINSHTVNVEFNAGLRFWLGYDIMSVSVYFSRPLIVGTDPIRVSGSSFEHTPSAVRRPFPSLGLGFAGDVLLLGISYDQLRNGATDGTRDPSYAPNSVLSRSLTFSLGFSLFNLSKNALAGTSKQEGK